MSAAALHSSNIRFSSVLLYRPALLLNFLALWTNLVIPKAGFYLGPIPVNFGYLLLGLGSFTVFIKILLGTYKLIRVELTALFFLIGNAVFQLITIFIWGSTVDMSMLFGHLTSMAIIPPLALLSSGFLLRRAPRVAIYRLMLWALGIVCFFGIINFLGLNVFKNMVGIPFLTFTGKDFDISTKYIDRGGVIKLISTYNNGNILGVNLLIWSNLALYGVMQFQGEIKRLKLIPWLGVLVRIALLLTLSRTVWIVMVFNEIFLRLFVFRRITQILSIFFVVVVLVFLVFGAAGLFVKDPLAFIFDANLGARRSQLDIAWSFWPNQPFSGTVEIVYASMLTNFGALGLGLFFLTWAWPALIPPVNLEGRLVQMGLFAYLLAMGADGAFIYVPTQATYWFLVEFAFNRFRVKPEMVT
jgi:hypothetical protein